MLKECETCVNNIKCALETKNREDIFDQSNDCLMFTKHYNSINNCIENILSNICENLNEEQINMLWDYIEESVQKIVTFKNKPFIKVFLRNTSDQEHIIYVYMKVGYITRNWQKIFIAEGDRDGLSVF